MDTWNKRKQTDHYTREQVERVLSRSGIAIQSEVDTDFIIFCPFHSNTRTPAGEVDKKTGLFFCFSCRHVCGLVDLIMHQTRKTYFEAVRFIRSLEVSSSIEDDINGLLVSAPIYVPYDEIQVRRLNSAALESPRAMSYFYGRRIAEDSVRKFLLGYSENRDMVTIPLHSPDGMLVGFVGRSVEGKDFKNTSNLPRSKTLFNLHRVKTSRTIYIVESSFDAIRLDQCGIPAIATLGATVSNFQVDLLKKYFNDIMVICDNDEAGKQMADRLMKALPERVTAVELDKRYKDVGDMSDEEIMQISVNFSDSISSLLK